MAIHANVHLTSSARVRVGSALNAPYIVVEPDGDHRDEVTMFLGYVGTAVDRSETVETIDKLVAALTAARVIVEPVAEPEPGPDDPTDEPTDEPAAPVAIAAAVCLYCGHPSIRTHVPGECLACEAERPRGACRASRPVTVPAETETELRLANGDR